MGTETKTRQVAPDVTVYEISGRLGLGDNRSGNVLYSIESAVRALIDFGARKIIIDLSNLNYIDSAGIGMLVGCNGHMNQNGGRMRIAGAQGLVLKSFTIVRIEQVVPLDPDTETACRNIAADNA